MTQAAEGSPAELQVPNADDKFFAGEDGVVAVFDFDYDLICDFKKKVAWAQFLAVPPCALLGAVCCTPCFINAQVEWDTRSKHVALTKDGIRYVQERRKTGWGLPCQDAGKTAKTVPYDKITDCDVEEPAGTACCCCIDNVLSQVNVDTASSSDELTLEGLKDAKAFKAAVWSMKRSEGLPVRNVGDGPSKTVVGQQQAPVQADMNTAILIEIRDELKILNKAIANRTELI